MMHGSTKLKFIVIYLRPPAPVAEAKIGYSRKDCHLVLTAALQSGVIETVYTGLPHILAQVL